MKILIIGGGNMATSLIGGLVADDYPVERLIVADPDAGSRQRLAGHFAIDVVDDNRRAVEAADVVILAVKPQVMRSVVREIAGLGEAGRRPLYVSIAAGVRSVQIERWLGGEAAIIRAMPNTPALVGSGATALFANPHVSAVQRDLAEFILRAVGLTIWVDDEAEMDAVTAVSGSGPAYLFYVMEAIEAAARGLGLPAETARLLTLQTTLGAARMAMESDEPIAELRRRVTSPGGTTERAIGVLEGAGVGEDIQRAVQAAYERSREISRLLEEESDDA